MDIPRVHRRLAEIYGGSAWVVVADAAAAATPNVERLREFGVTDILVIAATEGIGPLPETATFYTRSTGDTMMAGFRSFARSLDAPAVTNAIDQFDPCRNARILAPPFGAEDAFTDRRPYGLRKPAWLGLEDKTMIDAAFAEVGIETAPHLVVPVCDAIDASERLASEFGSVWAADNRQGWHGGGEYSRWVPDPSHAEEAAAWFADRAHRVRVMPFLDGIPCSIHGFVSDSNVAVFRPVEMLIARTIESPGFRYLGMATTWDPPVDVRRHMRRAARQMGRFLADTVDYLGPFSIDGVATSEGFRPTELNPRMSAGFGIQASSVEGLSMGLAIRALVEGDITLDASELEKLIVPSADRLRTVRIGIPVTEHRASAILSIRTVDGHVSPCGAREGDGTLEIGPAPGGSYVRLSVEPSVLLAGASAAPLAVSAAHLAAETWELEMPTLEPAPVLVTFDNHGGAQTSQERGHHA